MSQKIVKTLPVAKFYYKGNHSHPVRRTILITSSDRYRLKGYELREGSIVRHPSMAPIKTYLKERIAQFNQLRTDSPLRKRSSKKAIVRDNLKCLADGI